MDDFTGAASGLQRQQLHANYIMEHLRSLAWIVHHAKLQGIPEPLTEVFELGTIVSFSQQKFLFCKYQLTKIMDLTAQSQPDRRLPYQGRHLLSLLLHVAPESLRPPTEQIRTKHHRSIRLME